MSTDKDPAGRRRPRHKSTPVSLAEVAALAQVSTATVSRVINGQGKVSDDLRRKVEEACQSLGYVPNGPARALSSSRTMTIGAVVPTIENSAFALTVSALQRELNAAGYMVLLASSNYDPDEEYRETQMLLMRGVDGIVLIGSDHHPALLDLIDGRGVPLVETWTLSASRPSVGFDNAQAAHDLTEHIVSLGHRRIALIAGKTSHNDRSSARESGIRACLNTHGLSLALTHFIERPYRIMDGRRAMQALMDQEQPPTAVICGNDQIAFGALIEATQRGLIVPSDVSIAGFNDLDYAAHLSPPLTTIRVPAEKIGMEAARLMLTQLTGEAFAAETVRIPYHLVVRASTGRTRHGSA